MWPAAARALTGVDGLRFALETSLIFFAGLDAHCGPPLLNLDLQEGYGWAQIVATPREGRFRCLLVCRLPLSVQQIEGHSVARGDLMDYVFEATTSGFQAIALRETQVGMLVLRQV